MLKKFTLFFFYWTTQLAKVIDTKDSDEVTNRLIGKSNLLLKNKEFISESTDITVKQNKKTKKYNSEKVVLDLLNLMLLRKYDNYTFYCHNQGGCDAVFLIKSIYNIKEIYKNVKDFNPFALKISSRKDKVLKLTLSRKVGKKRIIKVKIQDSMAILPESLKALGREFNVDENLRKGVFSHKFSSSNVVTHWIILENYWLYLFSKR